MAENTKLKEYTIYFTVKQKYYHQKIRCGHICEALDTAEHTFRLYNSDNDDGDFGVEEEEIRT